MLQIPPKISDVERVMKGKVIYHSDRNIRLAIAMLCARNHKLKFWIGKKIYQRILLAFYMSKNINRIKRTFIDML